MPQGLFYVEGQEGFEVMTERIVCRVCVEVLVQTGSEFLVLLALGEDFSP